MTIHKDQYIREIEKHMEEQPWSIKCARCMNDLSVHCSTKVDSELDIHIQVAPCKCILEGK